MDQYIETDEPDDTTSINLKSHVTTDLEVAAVWTLDRETGILFQQIGDAWWAAYYSYGSRASWSSVLLLPAETIVGWLAAPVFQKEPLRCTIDYSLDFSLTCGAHGLTTLMQSDLCGWTVSTTLNQYVGKACPGAQEMILQAVVIYPEEEGMSK